MQQTRPSPSRDRETTAPHRNPEPARLDSSRDGSAAPPADQPARSALAPDWVPDDGLITRKTDRQVLVVGDTVAGVTLTHLLNRAGYDPVLVTGPETTAASRLAYLWPPVLRLLDAVGVDVPALDCGVDIDGVDVQATTQQGGTSLSREADTASVLPAVVRTARLRQRLEARLPDAKRGRDRPVDSLSHREGGLVVAFDDGVREWFDVAVDASRWNGPLRPDGGQAALGTDGRGGEFTTLTQYEVPVTADTAPEATATPARARIREGWQPGTLVQSLPRPDGPGDVLRVTTADHSTPATLTEAVRETLSDAPSRVPDLSGAEPASVQHVSSLPADPARTWWGGDRVAFCGGAACPFPPASGVRVSAGIEDALVFVSQLTHGPRSTVDAVDAYAARRARRVRRLGRAAAAARTDHEYPVPDRAHPGLATLGLLRTVALAPLLGAPVAGLQREGFE